MKAALAISVFGAALSAGAPALAVTVTAGRVNNLAADIWSWKDSAGNVRTAALKKEGAGNAGHGGYAIQMTYFVKNGAKLQKITVNADSGGDGGFGYFVSHERYRLFAGGAYDTIASRIFRKDDSPLGLGFKATTSRPSTPAGSGAERFAIFYGHYGTITPDPVDPDTGADSTPLPAGTANYAYYSLPVTTTWVFQDGVDYPRIDVSVDLSHVVPPGGSAPEADLVSFDVRGPYGVMVFDNGQNGIVKSVVWADREYSFTLTQKPVTRDSGWDWSHKYNGARFQALTAGNFEMGLYEPLNVAKSALVDGYSAERGFTSASFAAAGGSSDSSCGGTQILPSDGEWPYQSVQYSLPCGASALNTPTDGKKIAWGSTAYFGTSLTGVYNGQASYPFNGFPSGNKIAYSVCLVLARPTIASVTKTAAAAYAKANPISDCATPVVP